MPFGFRVQGSGSKFQGSDSRFQGSGFGGIPTPRGMNHRSTLGSPFGFRFQVSDFRVQVSGFRVQGSEFKFQASGFRVWRGSHPTRYKSHGTPKTMTPDPEARNHQPSFRVWGVEGRASHHTSAQSRLYSPCSPFGIRALVSDFKSQGSGFRVQGLEGFAPHEI